MILADKIIQHRKKNGWSQEELADKLGVSRQSVSKWEGALSVPDLDRIIQLSQLFGVSTDYLLKDDIETEASVPDTAASDDPSAPVRRVSMEEANDFLAVKTVTAKRIALAAFICILSPICLLILAAGADSGMLPISENIAAGIGIIVLLLLVTPAVAVFISCGMMTSRFEYLESSPIELGYGVDGMVKERMKNYRDKYAISNIVGACLCILAAVPLFIGALLTENDFYLMIALSITLVMVGIGVVFFITSGINQESMRKLLSEGEYSAAAKKNKRVTESISSIFWLVVTAGYLGYSFYTGAWHISWIVWPVAGVLFAAIMTAVGLVRKD